MENTKTYFLPLNNPSAEAARHALNLCREMNIVVPVQHGTVALEIIATPDQAEHLFRHGLFAAKTSRKFQKEQLERMPPELQEIAASWNHRFSAEYVRAQRDLTATGLSWSASGKGAPAPFIDLDIRQFRKQVDAELKRRKIDRSKIKNAKRTPAEKYQALHKMLSERLDDETAVHELGTLFRLSHEKDKELFFSPQVINEIIAPIYYKMKSGSADDVDSGGGNGGGGGGSDGGSGSGCRKMHGTVSVGIVFVESSKSGGPKFSTGDRNTITNKIKDGLSWLVTQHPSNNLSWTFDVQKTKIDVANKSNKDESDVDFDAYWREPGIGKIAFDGNTYTPDDAGLDAYKNDMMVKFGTSDVIVYFVTPYGTSWYAYSTGHNFMSLSPNGSNWRGWGIGALHRFAAHETSHQFGAADEYSDSSCTCSSLHGCDQIPNGNCADCAEPHQDCLMDQNTLRICQHTRAQIGWSDIFVELFTADVTYAGTDDKVWLDIGDRTFVLDVSGHDDRESGNREGYALWAGGNLDSSKIKRILIRKASDSGDGGWKLKRVKVFHQGELIMDSSPDAWIQDDKCWIFLRSFENTMVNRIKLKVTTADVSLAGTDSDVKLKMAGHSWNLDADGDDFERGDTNTFLLDPKTGIHKSDLKTISIVKAPDGIYSGWKLKGLQLIINDVTVYNNQSINKWLEDDSLIFTDGI